MGKIDRLIGLVVMVALAGLAGCNSLTAGQRADRAEARKVISLDGTWDIAEGAMDSVPAEFAARVPVPGLVDMAEPAFAEVGTVASELIPQTRLSAYLENHLEGA